MFTILLFIAFTTCILTAQAQNQTSNQWSKYKEDKSLEQFQSTLLNETFLPFLNECYNNSHLAPNYHTREIICSIYFDGILQLNSSNYIVDKPTVLKIRDQANTTDAFCEQKHNFPTKKNFFYLKPMDLNNSGKCGHSCLEDGGSTTKLICRFLAWMGDVISKNPNDNIQKVELKVPPVVSRVNVTEPTKDLQVDASKKVSKKIDSLSNKTNEDVLQDKITTDLNSIKKILKLPKVLAKPQPNNSSEKKQIINEGKINIAVPKKSSDEGEIDHTKQSSLDEVKGDATKLSLDENKGNVTKQSLDEEKVGIALPTSSSSAQVSNKPIQVENYSSADDETAEEAEDNGEKSEAAIINPENDQNHSSSQEIINNGNIAPTTTNKKKEDPFHEQSGSNFFTYLLVGMFLCIAMYVSYHNKSKILALVLEGRRGDKGRSGRRKHTAAYRKLDSNLEEAITSSARGRTTQIIY